MQKFLELKTKLLKIKVYYQNKLMIHFVSINIKK